MYCYYSKQWLQTPFLRSKTVSGLLHTTIMSILCPTESKTPTMKELNRYVVNKYAIYWKDIGFELDLECNKIDNIKANYLKCEERLYEVLKAWLELNDNTTWKRLEVAIINAKRVKSGMDPIDDVNGKAVSGVITMSAVHCMSQLLIPLIALCPRS